MKEKQREIYKILMIIYTCHVNDDAQLSNWMLFYRTMTLRVASFSPASSCDYFFFLGWAEDYLFKIYIYDIKKMNVT